METNIKILLPVCMVVVFIVTLGGALLPLKIFGRHPNQLESRRSQKIRSLCNCLAGGVFLATCFLGLIPSARKKFEEIFRVSKYETDYPVCEAVVIVGFFMILILEQIVISIQNKTLQTVEYVQLQQLEDELNSGDIAHHDVNVEDDEDDIIFASPSQSKTFTRPNGQASSYRSSMGNAHNSGHSHGHGQASSDHSPMGNAHNSGHSHGHSHGNGHSHLGNIDATNFLHSIILLLALSVHSIFEGMALGLQEEVKQIIYLVVAMVAHESLAAFALGASLLKSKSHLCAYVTYSIIFSSMIPLGAVIGVGIQATPSFAADVSSAIMQAIAGGIFIFVTFFEILNHEFENGSFRGLKIACTVLGYAALAALEVVG